MSQPVFLMRPGGQEGISPLKLYGRNNPWVQWALKRNPTAVITPVRRRGRRPRCPECRRAMWYRDNGWDCRRHAILKRIDPETLIAKRRLYDDDDVRIEVTVLEDKIVEIVYERGRWRARPTV